MPDPLDKKTVALGVTGSIACYKAVDLASKLVQSGAAVDVIMTHEATKFVAPLTFNSITHRPVVSDMFEPQSELGMDHVAIAQRADIVVVAPVTAHTLAKVAWGLTDDALTTTLLATQAPRYPGAGHGRAHVREPGDPAQRGEAEVLGILPSRPG